MSIDDRRAVLTAALERSRDLGFLGPGPVAEHIAHAGRFSAAVSAFRARRAGADGDADMPQGGPVRVADLGAGGGVPALPLLLDDDSVDVTLVDSSQRRMSFCAWALADLGVADRARTWVGRAEDLAHDPQHRGRYDVVVARGFGPPASTVECGAPLLVDGGWCVISEPPTARPWPTAIPELGLTVSSECEGVAVLVRRDPVGEKFPRPIKQQRRSPLFKL